MTVPAVIKLTMHASQNNLDLRIEIEGLIWRNFDDSVDTDML